MNNTGYRDFEDYLQMKHCSQHIGTKDTLIDDFESWLEEIGIDGIIEAADKYAAICVKKAVK